VVAANAQTEVPIVMAANASPSAPTNEVDEQSAKDDPVRFVETNTTKEQTLTQMNSTEDALPEPKI